ncbi:MAG: Asp-tRNA(Asn)/Glu-tRNA(Gln) amidotransferase subunit GatB [Candidatus Krumholzibacteriota bacterium]|nr:Asp-tRNA(Asn)/Glu-tRNA(Gln) amidotransferase subunit GatB [Candidatus Krumholzibacteriota bacterium]
MPAEKYKAVIGLEVHAQLNTSTKIFCACRSEYGGEPNTRTCPVCLGLPGALPVLNREAVLKCIRLGLALDCEISFASIFARKNYFYPDCPKNYQISMYDRPLCENGSIDIEADNNKRRIGIERIHLEDDAGKLLHEKGDISNIDFNRSGVPLVEIVTAPDIGSAAEAAAFLRSLRQYVRYLGICDGDLEKGSLRCDVNISLMLRGARELGTRTEIKNLNSFKAVRSGIEFEIERQSSLLDAGKPITQVTQLWDEGEKKLVAMRGKEEAHDYRYFPEPDLPPLIVDDRFVAEAAADMPELPGVKKQRFIDEYGLSEYDAGVLTVEKELADYFESLVTETSDPESSCKWVMREILGQLKDTGITIAEFSLSPRMTGELLILVKEGVINLQAAGAVFSEMLSSGEAACDIVKRMGLEQISSSEELGKMVDEVIAGHKEEVVRYQDGNLQLLGFFIGEAMKMSRGKANPGILNELFKLRLHRRD